MNFTNFFDTKLILERKVWGVNLLKGEKIVKLILAKILAGDMSLYTHSNTLTIKLAYCDLKIRLKAFNNYKDRNYKDAAAVFTIAKDQSPMIEIFFFEIFKQLKNYRGRSLDDLNDIMFRYIKNGFFKTKILSMLQHELEHAFEYDRGIDLYDKKAAYTDDESYDQQMKKYANLPHEINARIVQVLFKTNSNWSDDFKKGRWDTAHKNCKADVTKELRNIYNSGYEKKYLTPKNIRKFYKNVYSTLVYLWNHYSRQANKVKI